MNNHQNNMSNIHIKNGRLIDPSNQLDSVADIFAGDGKILSTTTPPDGFTADTTIDASELLVIPGIIDICARLREPGDEHKADIQSETLAAASAGITRLCIPPDTQPVIDEPAVIDFINHKAATSSQCKVSALGALTTGLKGEHLSEMFTLNEAGCAGVSNARHPVRNTLVLKRACSYAANCGLTIFIEPDDDYLSDNGNAHEGAVATRLGLSGIPVSAETTAIARVIEVISETKAKAHIGRLSAAKSVAMIKRAKEDGLDITADVSAHQLHLTEMDISSFNSSCHVLPPLRTDRDKEALKQGLIDGTIDAICSDHQPHEHDAKQAPFASTQPGISALETLLPLTLKLVNEDVIDMKTAVRVLCNSPANILGIDAGSLSVGSNADICIIDPEADWQLTDSNIKSRGKNTPFMDWDFMGRSVYTIIDGELKHSL